MQHLPVLQLRGWVSFESPFKYFMIGGSFTDLSGALSCRSWCIALQYCSSHLKLLDRVVRGAGLLAGCVLECILAYRQYVAV